MSDKKIDALVMGGNGFLGSHVVRALLDAGQRTRVMVRESSDVRALDGLDIELVYGDIMDSESLDKVMADCRVLYYCVVDTRSWLDDPAPLYRTNIDGLRNSLEAALRTGIEKLVFTSSVVTIGLNPEGIADETTEFNWHSKAPDYVLCRTQAEDMVLEYSRERGLPAVSLNVGITYGPNDLQPTPHGAVIAAVIKGKMPFAFKCSSPLVDIRDSADAMLLAAEHGRNGERYIIAAEEVEQMEMYRWAAEAVGVEPPKTELPIWVGYVMAGLNEYLFARFSEGDPKLRISSIRLQHIFSPMSNRKAIDELGWQPRAMRESIGDAARWYLENLKG